MGASGQINKFLEKYPWMKEYFEARGRKRPRAGGGEIEGAPAASVPVSVLDQDERDVIFAALERKRREWAEEYTPRDPPVDFGTNLLGGPWTQVNISTPADKVKAFPAHGDAASFCQKKGLKCTRAWKLALYTEPRAAALSWAFCKRLQYFYTTAAGKASYKFTDEDIRGAPRFDPFGLPDVPGKHPAHAAVAEVNDLVPAA